jgi:hypothetical protein
MNRLFRMSCAQTEFVWKFVDMYVRRTDRWNSAFIGGGCITVPRAWIASANARFRGCTSTPEIFYNRKNPCNYVNASNPCNRGKCICAYVSVK